MKLYRKAYCHQKAEDEYRVAPWYNAEANILLDKCPGILYGAGAQSYRRQQQQRTDKLMVWITFTILLLVLAIGGWKFRLHKKTKMNGREIVAFGLSKTGVPVITIVSVLAWLLLTAGMSMNAVEAGHIGLVKTFKDYTGQQDSGIHAKAPWQSVETVNGKVQKASISMNGGDNGSAVSSETQPVYATLTLNYRIQLAEAMNLYKDVGPNYYEAIIEPRVQQAFKEITVQYKTEEVAPNREKIRKEAEEILTAQLAPYGISVNGFLVKNLSFSSEFLAAIEDKQVATQQAKAANERVKVAEAEAAQAVATAKGGAEAVLIAANSEAKALRVKGAAARANPASVQLKAIESLNPNVEVIYLPSDSSVLLGQAITGQAAAK